MGRGLSDLQRRILGNLLYLTDRAIERSCKAWETDERVRSLAAGFGRTEWEPPYFGPGLADVYGRRYSPEPWTRSAAATHSRALARLELRGLIERQNDWHEGSGYTTCIKLTEEGRKVAESLTSKDNG